MVSSPRVNSSQSEAGGLQWWGERNCQSKEKAMTTARKIMNTNPLTVAVDTPLPEVAEKLAERADSGALVLSDAGAVIGVITSSDLISQHKNLHLPTLITLFDSVIPIGGPDNLDEQMKQMIGQNVGDIMSHDVVSVSPDASLEDVATIMSEQHKHLIPVVDNGDLLGVIDRSAILRAIRAPKGEA